MRKGLTVAEMERQLAARVGARYAVGMANGTCTLHAALVALGVQPGDRVAVPPLTMGSTTLAVLHAGAIPEFWDVDGATWLMNTAREPRPRAIISVSLYGLWSGWTGEVIDDAAETLNPHRGASFTSYSFEGSKVISCGEGGALVTDDEELALRVRSFSSLGYPMRTGARIDVAEFKRPDAIRHRIIGYNYRMSDVQAALVLEQLERADELLAARKYAADCYREAIQGCDWITPQYVPEGWPHSWWTYAFAIRESRMWEPLAHAIVENGGGRPYAAWRLTYQEPAFEHLAPRGTCPVAEDLQPRLMQLQTNHTSRGESERAAEILKAALDQVTVTA